MKKRILCLALLLLCLLTGCSDFENQMLAESGITETEEYKTYESYSAGGKLTEQGYYDETADAETKSSVPAGAAHITFAENDHLKVLYYTDAEHTQLLDTAGCYLLPGSRIYADVSVKSGLPTTYEFSCFRIYCYIDGKRTKAAEVVPDDSGLILELTEQYASAELSVEPAGEYTPREISLRAYCTSEDGTEQNISGTWTVNNETVSGNTAEVSPVSDYIVSYGYDSSEYFYVSSEPKCFYSNNEDGIVIFERCDPTGETADFAVELCPYVSVSLKTSLSRAVIVNGNEEQKSAGDMLEITGLKYGDKITIETDKEWQELENCHELYLQSAESLSDGNFRYTMILPQPGSEFVFDPSEYTYEHGSVTFRCFGETVTGKVPLAKGARITYEQASAEDGYWLGDDDHTIIVGSEEETRQALNRIYFREKVHVSVSLPQPSCGGSIRYYDGSEEILSGSYSAVSGTVITMKFVPWEGWINNYKNGETYVVTEDAGQIIQLGGESVDTAFTEDDSHKPELTVTLDKSVGDMRFTFSASGLEETECAYDPNLMDMAFGNCVVVNSRKIGTESDITFSLSNRAIPSGSAVKILVEKTDTDGNKTSVYRLTDNLTDAQEPIALYTAKERESSEVWYKSVKITVSVVDVDVFTAPKAPANSTITVRNTNYGVLHTGDMLEPSEKVTVTITPKDGYYISGSGVKNGICQDTTTFSGYEKNLQKILDRHPIEKYSVLTLTESDDYGVFTYKLNGKEVSGTISAKQGQTLTVNYEITVSDYVIDGAKGIIPAWGKGGRSQTKTQKITADMDGEIIDRDTVGIAVVKGA